MTSPMAMSPGSPVPPGLRLPDVIVTRRTRTVSMNGRIEDEVREGTVRFFCRSKGHGFIDDSDMYATHPVFMHISDIEGEYIPRKGDKVQFHQCPMPPRFDRPQAVMIQIVELTDEVHHKWTDKETPEEFLEDQEAIREEAKMNASLIQQMSPQRARQLSISSNGSPKSTPVPPPIFEVPNEAQMKA